MLDTTLVKSWDFGSNGGFSCDTQLVNTPQPVETKTYCCTYAVVEEGLEAKEQTMCSPPLGRVSCFV